MGLSWQQGPLSPRAIGRFLVPEPLPKRLLYVEPLRRRMRVRVGGTWIADSEDVLPLFEASRYPMAYFPETDVAPDTLQHASICRLSSSRLSLSRSARSASASRRHSRGPGGLTVPRASHRVGRRCPAS
jgi:hypothetical protein